jgi:glutamate decarboxylase
MPTLALNFSRPGAQVLLQYYQFLRLGREGYRLVQQDSLDVAQYLSSEIEKLGPFELVSRGDTIPVFAWRLRRGSEPRNWNLYDLADRLRMRGWLVPAYPMPDNMTDLVVQRIVVRVGLSRNLASFLLDAIKEEVALLESLEAPLPRASSAGAGFAH